MSMTAVTRPRPDGRTRPPPRPPASMASTSNVPTGPPSSTTAKIHDGRPRYTAMWPIRVPSGRRSTSTPRYFPSARWSAVVSRSAACRSERVATQTVPTPAAAAIDAATESDRIRRHRGALTTGRATRARRARVRDSNPADGSRSGVSSRISSFASARPPTSSRHSRHPSRWARARPRSSPAATSRASSAASSRVSPWLSVIAHLEGLPQLQKPRPDPGLGRPERDPLDLADLPSGPPEERRHEDSPSLLLGEPYQRLSDTLRIVGQDSLCLGLGAAVGPEVDQHARIHWFLPAQPQGVQGDVPGDGQEPGDHPASGGVERGRMPPGPQEGLLRHFFRQVRISQDRHGEAEHPALEPANERGRAVRIARGQAREQGLIGEGPHRNT